MKTRPTTLVRVILTISLIVGFTFSSFAQSKGLKSVTDHTSIAQISGTADGKSVSYTNPYNHNSATNFAGTFHGTLNSQAVKYYCIDLQHGLVYNQDYWDESNTPAEITYILNNYFPYKTSYSGKLSDTDREAAAIQFAIWHFSDGLDANTISSDNTIKSRALAIIADADANHNNVVPLETLIIVPAAQSFVQGTTASFNVFALDLNGNPISNASITLSTTLGSLSTTSGTTNSSGKFGPITLSYSGLGTATVKAKTNVQIPQGTRYVHKNYPDGKQKLVLATPSFDMKEVTATVEWYAPPANCDTHGYVTFTQGGWGSPSNSSPGIIRDTYFNSVFPSGLVLGGTYKLTLTSAAAVKNFLPQGSTAGAFTQNYNNPTSTSAGVLAGQLVALKMSVKYDAAGYLGSNPVDLGNLTFVGGPFSGYTVNQFLALAEQAIGGGNLNGFTFSQINDAATAINENFDNGTVDKGYLTCATECKNKIGDYVWRDKNLDGKQDSNEPGIPGVVVELLKNNSVIAKDTTDINGKYEFINLSNGTYEVRIASSNTNVGGALYSNSQTKWYATKKNQGSNDAIDSDGGINEKVSVTLNCNDDMTLDFGFYKTCISIEKTANKTTAKPGDVITYSFTVENCGDVQHHGGIDVYDNMLGWTSNNPYHIDLLNAGATTTFTKNYTVTSNDCGNLKNTVRADGHPVDGSATVTDTSSYTVTINCSECKNKIGDYVWHDKNLNGIQDSNEPGIPGVKVELVQNNTVIAISTTNSDGLYLFSNLSNGNYGVRLAGSNFQLGGALYSTNQQKWYSTKKNQGSDDAVDSDAGMGETVNVSLNCQDDLTIDFGFFSTGINIIKTSDVQTAHAGDVVTYTFTITNTGDLQLHGGVDVFDAMLNPNGNHLIKHIDVLNPGATTSFTMTYTVTSNDCGTLTNNVTAEGHPVEGTTTNCDTQGFITYTPGGWGAPANGNNPGTIRDAYFSTVFPSGLTVGGNYTLTLTNAAAVEAFLPSGGTPAVLTQNYTNPGGSLNNTLAGHIVSNTLAVKFNEAGYLGTNPTLLGDMVIASGPFAGMTVNQFLALANVTLGGGTTAYTLNQFTDAATAINENFDNGTTDNGYLICATGSITYASVIAHSSATIEVICENEKADLKIEKFSSTANPQCGEQFSYTVKVTNLGPSEAKDIQAADVLPAGINFISYAASQGTYDENTGLWEVGDLANGSNATLTITVTADCDQINNSTFDFGVASDYNLFVIQDATQPSADTQGKVAVGHDASFGNYSIGDQLPANSGDVLIVGHDLTYTSGAVYNGNVVYGHATNLPQSSVSISGGTLRQDNPINFATAKVYLENLSTTLGGYAVNGTTASQWGGINLTGNDPFLNVFSVTGVSLSSANNVSINVPSGSAVLVNIDGSNITWSGGLTVSGTTMNNVLYNFYEATQIQIQGIDVKGSILAPFAAVNFVSGVQNGQMICKSLTGSGQFNYAPFGGNIPVDTQITNVASIIYCATPDDNPNNNSASVTITASVTSNNNGGNNGGNSGNNNGGWQQVNGFGAGEIIYSMTYSGNVMYAGTWGGKIYMSSNNGQTWTVINSGMNVSFIWSLQVSGGFIFAATEQGVYKYNGSTWSLTTLAGIDVHALAIYNGTIYAGTYGLGLYKSDNNGLTWTAINNGFGGFLAIQSLTITVNGEIFVGTAGGGIFKSSDNGASFHKLSCGYEFIWALGSTSNNTIFAGSYGDGLYRSLDGGSTFSKISSLNVPFIYSIIVDSNDKIYVSSWASGVFVSSDNGNTWSSLGMNGFGVSAMVVNSGSDQVFVGTKEGKVYVTKASAAITDVNNEDAIPTKFELSQNYPNPFNPTTTIRFAIPEAGNYSLKVYDVLGQEVASLVNGQLNAGVQNVTFDASRLASGMYIYRLTGSNVTMTKKMILMK